ncbi:MAG: hypothetical protein J7545_08225 [Roseofilum sp. SBFL]|uniref:hypothetical protein n=1 Tax=Roseofilum sp. SBFL TaxID=2821496 RepID=UPI001B160CE3|nr:hypothetical protein [Roseofilum sp. SBFL]MBP0041943.1 hypothetical protein [Roseofilum sp. SBFL]
MDINSPNSHPFEPTNKRKLGTAEIHRSTELPPFPKYKPTRLSRYQNQYSPNLAIDVLHDIEAIACQWQDQLDQIHDQITALYHQGPIIEGWLESTPNSTHRNSSGSSCTSYRLCRLNENGEVWSRPCPSEEVASMSLAIHRYQQLRQFLNQKHMLEERLSKLAQSLKSLHRRGMGTRGDGDAGTWRRGDTGTRDWIK